MTGVIKDKTKGEILAEFISKLGYGEIVKHEEISETIGERYGTIGYRTIISQARKILLGDYKICIESIRGVGYRRVLADDFTKHTLGYYKRGFNAIQHGMDVLSNAPTQDMSEDGLQVHRHVYDRTRALEASMKGAIVEVKALRDKQHPFLPENVGRK